jgi:hypothetical protein
MISQYSKLAKVEPIADLGFDFFAKAIQYKSEKIQQTRGALQSTLSNFANNVDIMKEDDRQYFNEKVKNVVDNLNSFKDVDLSDPNTAYQLQSMLGEVKQDTRISDSIVSSSNIRNIQKEQNLMLTNPKFKDLYDPDLYQADQEEMLKYLNNPGGKFTQQHASINPNIQKQLDEGFKTIAERKQINIIGENVVTNTIKDQGLLYQNGQDIVNKNSGYFIKTFGVKYNLEKNPIQAIKDIDSLLGTQYNYFKNKKTELEVAKTTSSKPNIYDNEIAAYDNKLESIKQNQDLVKKGEDVNQIKNIGLNAYMQNTAIQQSSKGYSYMSKIEMSDQSKLDFQFKASMMKLSAENEMDVLSDARKYEMEIAKITLQNQGDLDEKLVGIYGKNSTGKKSSSPIADNQTGLKPEQTILEDTKGQNIDYYNENRKKRVGMYNEMMGLQKDLVKIMYENSLSNPKLKTVLEKYPDLNTKLYGIKTMKSILASANMLSSMSGDRLENGATAEGSMRIINQIKEKTLLFNLNKKQEDDLVKITGKDPAKYNESYKALYGETTFKRGIPLDFLNNLDKDSKPIFNTLVPELRIGKILTKDGKVFDNNFRGANEGVKILENIDWEKSGKGTFNVENSTVEIIPKNSKGEPLSKEKVLIKVSPDFTTKMRTLGWNDMINNINKPNTEVDYFIKQPNNTEYLKLIKNQVFYVDTNKAKNVPKGTILEYQITNVKDPIPSAGDSRKDYIYDVSLNIKGKPYSFSVNSTADIHAKINQYAIAAKQQATDKFTKQNKQPSVAQLEQETFNIFIDLLTRIK